MFTIKSGDKYILSAKNGSIQTTGRPVAFNSFEGARAIANQYMIEGRRLVEVYDGYANAETTKVDKARKDIAKQTAKLAELYEQPFGQVEQKVKNARSAIERAKYYITNNSIQSYRQQAARIAKICDTMSVVDE